MYKALNSPVEENTTCILSRLNRMHAGHRGGNWHTLVFLARNATRSLRALCFSWLFVFAARHCTEKLVLLYVACIAAVRLHCAASSLLATGRLSPYFRPWPPPLLSLPSLSLSHVEPCHHETTLISEAGAASVDVPCRQITRIHLQVSPTRSQRALNVSDCRLHPCTERAARAHPGPFLAPLLVRIYPPSSRPSASTLYFPLAPCKDFQKRSCAQSYSTVRHNSRL